MFKLVSEDRQSYISHRIKLDKISILNFSLLYGYKFVRFYAVITYTSNIIYVSSFMISAHFGIIFWKT